MYYLFTSIERSLGHLMESAQPHIQLTGICIPAAYRYAEQSDADLIGQGSDNDGGEAGCSKIIS